MIELVDGNKRIEINGGAIGKVSMNLKRPLSISNLVEAKTITDGALQFLLNN